MKIFGKIVLKFQFLFLVTAVAVGVSSKVHAQEVVVDVTTNVLDFKAKTKAVKGSAVMKNNEVSAENIVVDLTTLKTEISMRDDHVQKHLDTKKFPEAVLLSATGKSGKGQGRIKIRGIEKGIEGTYKTEGKMLVAEFKLNLDDFDIHDLKYMGTEVENTVVLHVSIPIK
ncbi:MAG TPA: YceI family protein [Bdellovibrio sp.]|nr:YceI family protein [Bdellovibrio sp.]